ncbi:MarR family winged helix-turn-helix transcriptional regulator [Arachidicoccus terrestris]|uniref:MarR family winged helix-turn-helix transcriptional regulator n=1 Tax=Arachidicoccus terrestris TaxID=2875539 RepID=UPI001CC39361|nr:MarR family winged helix-turn-helix transcriptional regulator [Arachidicoccus terrestris]UAY54775.1 MarR family winged helix-turn-helix transcriptional regulator [Arachidicoccus terrestris]
MTKTDQYNPFSVEKAEDSTGFLLWQVTNLWQRMIKQALEPYNLTHSQFVLLAGIHWLTKQMQDITQITLSNHTKIDPMTTSSVLRKLELKKLIERREHSMDTRAKEVVLTNRGLGTAKEAIRVVEQFDHQFFSKLGADIPVFNKYILSLLKI